MRRLSVVLGVLVVGVAAFLFVVTKRRIDPVGRPRIRLQLQWFDQAQFIGFYVAKQRGFYDKQGIDVELISGGYNNNPIQRVLTGVADVGLATGDQVLIRRASGDPLKAFGNVFNRSLAAFMTRTEKAVHTPEDLVGKRVGVYRGFDTENILLALLQTRRINPSDVRIETAAGIQAFVDGELDAFPAYVINEPLIMANRNVPISLMNPAEFNVNFVSDTYFTTENYWKANRAVLARFLHASAEGWKYAQDHPEEALQIMFAVVNNIPESDRAHQRAMLGVVLRYLGGGDQNRLFYMNRDHWESMEQSLFAIGKIPSVGFVAPLCDFDLANKDY
jgi:NitT/TauT family transport system substrate-binding protein